MKVLVTGSHGFIGKNLCVILKRRGHEVIDFNSSDNEDSLKKGILEADFIVHLAGVNRSPDVKEFIDVNFGLTKKIIQLVQDFGSKAPVLLASSTLASEDTPYGKSKALAESVVNNLGFGGHPVYVYRLAHVFGKWSRPNYNSVVATFCYCVSRGLPIEVNEKASDIDFVYVDDVCKEFVRVIEERPLPTNQILSVKPTYPSKPFELANIIRSFRLSRETLMLPVQNGFEKKLYATYLSFLPENKQLYPLASHSDDRGSFTEFLKTSTCGQFSVNVIKPGAIKGNHFHMNKNEKYLVVTGSCEIKERSLFEEKISTCHCSDKNLAVVDVAPGYVHSIKNVGPQDAVVLMWSSDIFDKNNDDTYPEPVEHEAL